MHNCKLSFFSSKKRYCRVRTWNTHMLRINERTIGFVCAPMDMVKTASREVLGLCSFITHPPNVALSYYFPQSTFHLFLSANLWGDRSNSLVL